MLNTPMESTSKRPIHLLETPRSPLQFAALGSKPCCVRNFAMFFVRLVWLVFDEG